MIKIKLNLIIVGYISFGPPCISYLIHVLNLFEIVVHCFLKIKKFGFNYPISVLKYIIMYNNEW